MDTISFSELSAEQKETVHSKYHDEYFGVRPEGYLYEFNGGELIGRCSPPGAPKRPHGKRAQMNISAMNKLVLSEAAAELLSGMVLQKDEQASVSSSMLAEA